MVLFLEREKPSVVIIWRVNIVFFSRSVVDGDGSLGMGLGEAPLLRMSLKDLLMDSMLSSPVVSVSREDQVREAANLLPHYLETFTDSLVAVWQEKPVGIVGGKEVLEGVLRRPRWDFFEKTKVGEIMSRDLVEVAPTTSLGELLERYIKAGRAFAMMPNEYHGYSALSARKLLEIGLSRDTGLTLGDVSGGTIHTFTRDQRIGDIMESMLKNRTRKLMLEGTREFISDRIIIQKISRELGCLKHVDDFLDIRASEFNLDSAKTASEHDSLQDGCRLMYGMQSPCLLLPAGIVTPWDVVMGFRLQHS